LAEQLAHCRRRPTCSELLRDLGHEDGNLYLGQPRDVPRHEPLDNRAGFRLLELAVATQHPKPDQDQDGNDYVRALLLRRTQIPQTRCQTGY
jgi:hypothetical protein